MIGIAGCIDEFDEGGDDENEDDSPALSEATQEGNLRLTSPAFDDGERIPDEHGYDEENVNPPLEIDEVSDDERSSSTVPETVPRERAIDVVPEFTKHHVVLTMDADVGETVEIEANGKYLFTATVGRDGEIQHSRGTAVTEELERAIDDGRPIFAIPAGE